MKVNDIVKKLIDGVCDDPDELSKDLLILSANMYNVGQSITTSEIKYAKKWTEERTKYKTDKETDTALKASQEYKDLEQNKNAYKMMLEVIRSAKKRLQVLSDNTSMKY